MATTIKTAAKQWLVSKFGAAGNTVHASKLHGPQSLWWIDIPKKDIETPKSNEIDLLCQSVPDSNKFYYLKVPVKFFKEAKLEFDVHGMMRLHLSAEPDKMFVQQRGSGKGKVRFHQFLQTL